MKGRKRQARRMAVRWSYLRDDRGVAAIEFALILMVVVVMMCGAIEYGFVLNERTEIENSARAGAQLALQAGYSSSNVQTAVLNSTNLSLAASDVTSALRYECQNALGTAVTASTTCNSGAPLEKFLHVAVSKTYTPFFPFLDAVTPDSLSGGATVRIP
jgi:Flp pilus assembly protein TadG